jgi:hypothetical protein
MSKVFHPAQSGSRLSWDDDLFRKVEQADPNPQPAIDQPEVSDSDWAAFDDACGGDQAAYRMVA